MSKKCELTGKSPLKGHKVSHANNKMKRKFFPNLKKITFKSHILKRNIKLNVSNSALRTVDYKGGLDFYLKRYPLYKDLEYEIQLETENINKFYKIIGVKKDKNLKEIKALINGKINLDAQKYYLNKITINEKNIQEKKRMELKNYLDKNVINYFNLDFNLKSINLFLKDLIEFI